MHLKNAQNATREFLTLSKTGVKRAWSISILTISSQREVSAWTALLTHSLLLAQLDQLHAKRESLAPKMTILLPTQIATSKQTRDIKLPSGLKTLWFVTTATRFCQAIQQCPAGDVEEESIGTQRLINAYGVKQVISRTKIIMKVSSKRLKVVMCVKLATLLKRFLTTVISKECHTTSIAFALKSTTLASLQTAIWFQGGMWIKMSSLTQELEFHRGTSCSSRHSWTSHTGAR